MINENLTKSDLKKIKSLIRKEVDSQLKKEVDKNLEKEIKKIIKKDYSKIEDFDNNFDKKVEDITKEVMQAFHKLLYREPYIIKRKVKR